jgi:hypothetical protein
MIFPMNKPSGPGSLLLAEPHQKAIQDCSASLERKTPDMDGSVLKSVPCSTILRRKARDGWKGHNRPQRIRIHDDPKGNDSMKKASYALHKGKKTN